MPYALARTVTPDAADELASLRIGSEDNGLVLVAKGSVLDCWKELTRRLGNAYLNSPAFEAHLREIKYTTSPYASILPPEAGTMLDDGDGDEPEEPTALEVIDPLAGVREQQRQWAEDAGGPVS